MRKIFLILFFSLTFFSVDIFAQAFRSTSFDDRGICEKTRGVWREFGNGCIDECHSKFDQFSVCTQAATFGCDCGKGRCWDGGSCVSQKSYKKVFDIEQEEEQKVMDEAREKRKIAAKENEQMIMNNLTKNIAAPDPSGKTSVGNNLAQFYKDTTESVADSVAAAVPAEPTSAITQIPAQVDQAIKEAPPIVIDTGDVKVPAMFLQKEEQAKKALAEVNKAVEAQTPPKDKSTDASVPPGLPVIPLPN